MGFDKDKANKICQTFYSYFCELDGKNEETNIKSLQNKTIFKEEFSMTPNKQMTLISKAFLMHNNTIYMFGDPN